jgi:hypothetical protein
MDSNIKKQRLKIYLQLKRSPQNIRFINLKKWVLLFGFLQRKSGHHVFTYARKDIPEIINIQPNKKESSKAKPYQVKQFINIIEKFNLLENE